MATASALAKKLQKETVPINAQEIRLGGAPLIGNPDPVLNYLAIGDEKVYSQMERNDLTIRAARKRRDSTILSAGYEIIKGESDTAASKTLRDFVHSAFKRIKRWAAVEQRMLDAIYWGWRPLEIVWTTDFRWKRKTYWAIDRVVEKPPEDFWFTKTRDLVYINPITREQTHYTSDTDKLKWVICTSGSVDNPYGDAVYKYVWLTYYAKSRFFEMWSQGMARSTGLLRFKESFSNLELESGAKAMSQVKSEISEVIDFLNNNNVLLERQGWATEFLSDVRGNESWMKSLEYLNKIITTGIAGENLSFQEGKFGTRAQAVTHEATGTMGAMPDAEQLDEWVNEYVVTPMVKLNFGDPSLEEMPEYRSLVRRPVDVQNAKTLWDMGAKIDGDYLAKELNIKLANDETDMVLKGGNEKTTGPTPYAQSTVKEKVRQEDEKSRDRGKAGDSGGKG